MLSAICSKQTSSDAIITCPYFKLYCIYGWLCRRSRATVVNSFHAIGLFPYPLKKPEDFLCLQGVQKVLRKNRNLHKTKITHQHFCWFYYTFFSLLMFHRIRVFKKRDVCNCVQLIATNCNWLQPIAIETVCNWFKYKCLQTVKQIQFLFSWGIKSPLYFFLFIYLSLSFSLYKYL